MHLLAACFSGMQIPPARMHWECPWHTNRLANEASPHLLLHKHNPNDRFPWRKEALERAHTSHEQPDRALEESR